MNVVNILGTLDDYYSKAKVMIIASTIISFMEFCIDEKVEPKLDEVIKYVKEKTGLDVDEGYIKEFLSLMIGNLKMFIMFLINEQCENIADNMLDNPSNLGGFLRRTV